MSDDKAGLVLSGPLGRALLAEIVGFDWFAVSDGISLVTKVAEALPKLDSLSECDDELSLLAALESNPLGFGFQGDHAEWDLRLSDAAPTLSPIVEALVSCPATQHWWEPLAKKDQRWLGLAHGSDPTPRGETVESAIWRIVEEEVAAQSEPGNVSFYERALTQDNCSGTWWSTPFGAGVMITSCAGPGNFPCFSLAIPEDPFGEETFVLWDVLVEPEARVYEIESPKDWTNLVNLAPLDVTITRDPDWARWAGVHGPWLLPDWRIVGETFDAVHVTMGGYLATRGHATEVEEGFTFLAGWEAESTLWLRDVFLGVNQATTWTGRPGQGGLPDPFRL